MNFNPISKIDLGSADGKKEARHRNFETLFYLGDGYYDQLLHDDKYLITGRKGTGKSLLIEYFKKQMEKNKHTYCKLLRMPRFMSEKLTIFSYSPIQKEEMETFWRYVFLKEIITIINEKDRKILNRKATDLKKEIDTLNVALKEVTITETASLNTKLSLTEASIGAGLGSEDKAIYVPGKYYANLDNLSNAVMSYISKSKSIFYIIFDDIDELSNKFNDPKDFKNILLAFLNALETINDDLYDHNTGCKIISTFRTDLIEQLNSNANNLNKVLFDSSIEIKWFSQLSKTEPHKAPLSKMIMHKARNSIEDYSPLSDVDLYELIFPSNKKKVNNSSEYLMFRSFGRPRDIIVFLKTYQEMYPEEPCFSYENFNMCLNKYSSWFYGEILNEVNISDDKKSILASIDAIKKMGTRYFKLNQFSIYYAEFTKSNTADSLNDQQVLTQLYKLGVIGNVYKEGKSSNRYWFSYRDGSPGEPDFSKDFVVHLGLQNYLSL